MLPTRQATCAVILAHDNLRTTPGRGHPTCAYCPRWFRKGCDPDHTFRTEDIISRCTYRERIVMKRTIARSLSGFARAIHPCAAIFLATSARGGLPWIGRRALAEPGASLVRPSPAYTRATP
jgi:hypothetical protein